MPNLRCPYCGVVLDGESSVKHRVDCPFCHSTFVPRRKGVNRLLQTLLIMAILAAISLTVLVIAGLVNPQSVVSFGLLLLAGLYIWKNSTSLVPPLDETRARERRAQAAGRRAG